MFGLAIAQFVENLHFVGAAKVDTDSTRAELNTFLTTSAREDFRGALDKAYRDAGSRFDAQVGADAQWFSWTVWKFGEHRLKTILEPHTLELRNASSGGQFRIGFGPFVMVAYHCGQGVPDDPWKEFPNNDKGAGLLTDINTGQYALMIEGFEGRPAMAMVLAHYGNHETGLEALYLKVPCAQNGGRICRWSYVEELWSVGGSARDVTQPVLPILPGPVKIDSPVLPFRKPVKKSDTESA